MDHSHPHDDRYGALKRICSRADLVSRVEIQKIVCHFPEEFKDKRMPAALASIRYIYEITDAEKYKPVIGQKMEIDQMEFHILNSPVDCTVFDNSNQLCLIFTVQSSHKKIMFTGNAFPRNLQMVLWRYPSGLECDILQMSHHGLCDTGHRAFYEKVNAKTLLILTLRVNEQAMLTNPYYYALSENNRWAEENASVIYKTYEGTTEIAI